MQSKQAVLLALGVNLPAGQSMHDSVSGDGAYEPGRHGLGSAEPTEQLVPAGQMTH